MPRTRLRLSLAFVSFVGCALPPPHAREDEVPHVAALTASPGSLHVGVGEKARIALTGSDDDGSSIDVAPHLHFTSQDPKIASVDDDGAIVGVAPGETALLAKAGAASISVPVVVAVVRRAPPPARGPLGYVTSLALTAGLPMDPLAPSSSSSRASSSTSVSFHARGLPRGLAIDARTGVVSGAPTIAQAARVAVIERVDGDHVVEARVAIEVRCDQAVAPVEEDAPDPDFVDENGDGVDGMACGPVFVSPLGDDVDDGTLDHPKQTLAAALELAAALDPPRPVYAAAGSYDGPIELFAGARIHGGYDPASFRRGPDFVTRITGSSLGVLALHLKEGVVLDRLSIEAADAVEPGEPSVGLLVDDVAGAVRLIDVHIAAGNGADGVPGVNGERGFDGDTGIPGGPGCARGPGSDPAGQCAVCDGPAPGKETGQGFGNGGAGGMPGLGVDDGFDGIPADDGAPGGAGGASTAAFNDGKPGAPGADGKDGDNGKGGYADDDGEDGAAGEDGHGGGGGGGGAGGDGACTWFGGAGGSGGAGGAGGQGGGGGGRGGGSFGVAVSHATVRFEGACRVSSAHGGKGGDGGKGGAGGVGGNGAPGGAAASAGGSGGAGGNGGIAGKGGAGGGGGGGSSVALLVDDEKDVEGAARVFVHVGRAGGGGAGPGASGADGVAATEKVSALPGVEQ